MAVEVAHELVVVRGQVADTIVHFRAGVYDRGGGVCEAGEVDAIFLGLQRLHVLAFSGIVDVEGIVVAGCNDKLSIVVEVEGRDRRITGLKSEKLESVSVMTV